MSEERKLGSGSIFLGSLGDGSISDYESSSDEEDTLMDEVRANVAAQEAQILKQTKILFPLTEHKAPVPIETLHPSWTVRIRKRHAENELTYCGTVKRFKVSHNSNTTTTTTVTMDDNEQKKPDKIVHASIIQKRKERELLAATNWSGKKTVFKKDGTKSVTESSTLNNNTNNDQTKSSEISKPVEVKKFTQPTTATTTINKTTPKHTSFTTDSKRTNDSYRNKSQQIHKENTAVPTKKTFTEKKSTSVKSEKVERKPIQKVIPAKPHPISNDQREAPKPTTPLPLKKKDLSSDNEDLSTTKQQQQPQQQPPQPPQQQQPEVIVPKVQLKSKAAISFLSKFPTFAKFIDKTSDVNDNK
jgi:hypothetical protein